MICSIGKLTSTPGVSDLDRDLDYSAFEESESVRMYCYELDTKDMKGMNFAALYIEFTRCLNREISRRG